MIDRELEEKKWLSRIDKVLNSFDDFEVSEECYTWKNTDSIKNVLKEIGKEDTHLFYPMSGGMHFDGCEISDERGFIDLKAQGTLRVLPSKLQLYKFGGLNWSYFILETERSDRKLNYDIGEKIFSESLLAGRHEVYYEFSEENCEFLLESGENIKRIERIFSPVKYANFNEYSLYNDIDFTSLFGNLDAYDGLQNKYSSEEFNKLIKRMKSTYEKALNKNI